MIKTYHIQGIKCNGCCSHLEEVLSKVKGVTNAAVDLEKAEAVIEMNKHIPIETFQETLKNDGGKYSILRFEGKHYSTEAIEESPNEKGTGTFYCPMHCEWEKTYSKAGDCPVCGMDLI